MCNLETFCILHFFKHFWQAPWGASFHHDFWHLWISTLTAKTYFALYNKFYSTCQLHLSPMACPARPNLVPRLAFPPIFPVFSCIQNPFGTRGKTYDCKPNHNIPFAFGPLKKSKSFTTTLKTRLWTLQTFCAQQIFFQKNFMAGPWRGQLS